MEVKVKEKIMPRDVSEITILSTGGTFNKIYDPLTGELRVDSDARALDTIARHWRCTLRHRQVVGKDSLELTDEDRETIYRAVLEIPHDVLIVHGTDTMDRTARYLAERLGRSRRIVLTGAMVPYSIDPVEATANLALGLGRLLSDGWSGIEIAMNGCIGPWNTLTKNRTEGRFQPAGTF